MVITERVEAPTGFGYTFGLAGRQTRVLALFPAAFGNIAGNVSGQPERQNIRGLADPRFRFSIGLRGAPAGSASEIAEAARVSKRSAMGAAVTVMPPLGQYNREQVANLGYNLWPFKPEIGLTQTIDHWTFDGMAGVWLFTDNHAYTPASRTKEQCAMVSFQGHVSYALPHRRMQSLKLAYSTGLATLRGTDFDSLSITWQFVHFRATSPSP